MPVLCKAGMYTQNRFYSPIIVKWLIGFVQFKNACTQNCVHVMVKMV